MQELPAALAAFAAYPQFVLYRLVPRNDGSGKTDKFPVDSSTGAVSDAHNPLIWLSADAALLAAAAPGIDGIGFVFTATDPFFFFDIDDCLEESGQWSDWANYLCGLFTGAAVEISQSGQGLHIFGRGQAPLGHACKAKDANGHALPFDLYTVGRFAALTGTGIAGDAGTDHTAALQQIAAAYLAPGPTLDSADWTDGPVEGYGGPEDDDELLARMLRSRSTAAVMGGKASIKDLWERNEDILGACYPHDQGLEAFDHSAADMALCSHLAFWTGKDCERIDRLFQRSALCRDKWLDREHNYRIPTILKAIALCSDVYNPTPRTADPETGEAPVPVDPGAAVVGELRAGFQYLAVTQQQQHFNGCTYVRDLHRVFMPDGALLKQEQFNAVKGGFVFSLDSINDKTTKKAWEVFTESQAYIFPRAHGVCFRPELPTGVIIEEDGQKLINTYIPIKTPRVVGDPAPFLGHLARMLPNQLDREILLAYMAAIVQHKGSKFQWAPLIQGVEGNGKSLIGSILTAAVGRRYTHKVNPKDIGNVFNAWVSGNLLAVVDEVYTADRRDMIETLKWLITESIVPLTSKGLNQVTGDNRVNFVMTTNHKDAIRKTISDRRNAVFFTAQQIKRDKARDGMGGAYFPQLYNWFRSEGFAIMTDFLHNYKIPIELNPALDCGGLCNEAPQTSSTAEALAIGMGPIEQEILEAVDEGRPGFAGGWISSAALDKLLEERRASNKIPINKRREILQDIGYDWHPSLKGGRVNNPLPFETGKPRLYIREGHISRNLKTPAEVVKAYSVAQGYPVMGAAGAAATG